MNKTILMIIMCMILSIFTVFASDTVYQPETNIQIPATYTEYGIYTESISAITIYSPANIVLIDQEPMNIIDVGRFYYNYLLPQQQGDYSIKIDFYKNDTLQGSETRTLYVYYDTAMKDNVLKVWSCPASYGGIYLILGLAVLLIIFSLITQEHIFGILGGIIVFFSYFYIGACGPLITAPLLVAGILITVLFAT